MRGSERTQRPLIVSWIGMFPIPMRGSEDYAKDEFKRLVESVPDPHEG